MAVSADSAHELHEWVKYGMFWHVYPLGFCGADIRPAGPREFHGRGLDALIPWLEYAVTWALPVCCSVRYSNRRRTGMTRLTICTSMCGWEEMLHSTG